MLPKYKGEVDFSPVFNHVNQSFNQLDCSGSSVFVIHNENVVLEEYMGNQSKRYDARPVLPDTQFHVASVRKTYIGFAVAYAVYYDYIKSIDDPVLTYLPELDEEIWKDTTIRHLLTHTHGLSQYQDNVFREYPAGQYWTYRQVGIDALTKIVKQTTTKTVSAIVHELVFNPLGFSESNWYANKNKKLVDVILQIEGDKSWKTSESTEGDQMNMYISSRELAFWGYLHLKQGQIDGMQIVPKEMIELVTSLQSPSEIHLHSPRNGFLWFVQDRPVKYSEIGESVPKGSYQILGYTGVTLLVIPQENVVAVRMFNSFGSPEGYDYLSDVRSFGDTIMGCLRSKR